GTCAPPVLGRGVVHDRPGREPERRPLHVAGYAACREGDVLASEERASQRSTGSDCTGGTASAIANRGRPKVSTSPSRSIVSRFERSTSFGNRGHGVSTTAAISRLAERAHSIVINVWLIVPRPGRAAITSGRPSSNAKSRTR